MVVQFITFVVSITLIFMVNFCYIYGCYYIYDFYYRYIYGCYNCIKEKNVLFNCLPRVNSVLRLLTIAFYMYSNNKNVVMRIEEIIVGVALACHQNFNKLISINDTV